MADHPQNADDKEKVLKPEEEALPSEKKEALELADAEVLKQFDAFEVEDMPESNELQERRRKIKNQLRDLDVETNADASAKAFSEEDEGGFLDILKEAGLGVRQLRFCLGGLFLLGLLSLLIYGGIRFFSGSDFSFDFFESDTSVEPPISNEDEGSNHTVNAYPDSTLWSGMDLGGLDSIDNETLDSGEDLGLEGNGDESLERHINEFSKMYEAAQVDVNELLNKSSNRREALQDYVDELNFYLHLGVQGREELQEESATLTRAFSTVEDRKNEKETLFFEKLDSLDAYASTAALNSFVGYSQELIRLRAHYLAREKLLSYYEQVLPYVETKIRDIGLNEEALVKGIQVVEVEGSGLNLIQQESDL